MSGLERSHEAKVQLFQHIREALVDGETRTGLILDTNRAIQAGRPDIGREFVLPDTIVRGLRRSHWQSQHRSRQRQFQRVIERKGSRMEQFISISFSSTSHPVFDLFLDHARRQICQLTPNILNLSFRMASSPATICSTPRPIGQDSQPLEKMAHPRHVPPREEKCRWRPKLALAPKAQIPCSGHPGAPR